MTLGVTAEVAVEPPACPRANPGMDPARRRLAFKKVDLAKTIDGAVKEQVKNTLHAARRNVGLAETIDRAVKELLGLLTEETIGVSRKPGDAAEASVDWVQNLEFVC